MNTGPSLHLDIDQSDLYSKLIKLLKDPNALIEFFHLEENIQLTSSLSTEVAARFYNLLGDAYKALKTEKAYHQAIEAFTKSNNYLEITLINVQLDSPYHKIRNLYDKIKFAQVEDQHQIAAVKFTVGHLSFKYAERESLEDLKLESIKLLEEAEQAIRHIYHRSTNRLRSRICGNLQVFYQSVGKTNRIETMLLEMLKLDNSISNISGMISYYNSLQEYSRSAQIINDYIETILGALQKDEKILKQTIHTLTYAKDNNALEQVFHSLTEQQLLEFRNFYANHLYHTSQFKKAFIFISSIDGFQHDEKIFKKWKTCKAVLDDTIAVIGRETVAEAVQPIYTPINLNLLPSKLNLLADNTASSLHFLYQSGNFESVLQLTIYQLEQQNSQEQIDALQEIIGLTYLSLGDTDNANSCFAKIYNYDLRQFGMARLFNHTNKNHLAQEHYQIMSNTPEDSLKNFLALESYLLNCTQTNKTPEFLSVFAALNSQLSLLKPSLIAQMIRPALIDMCGNVLDTFQYFIGSEFTSTDETALEIALSVCDTIIADHTHLEAETFEFFIHARQYLAMYNHSFATTPTEFQLPVSSNFFATLYTKYHGNYPTQQSDEESQRKFKVLFAKLMEANNKPMTSNFSADLELHNKFINLSSACLNLMKQKTTSQENLFLVFNQVQQYLDYLLEVETAEWGVWPEQAYENYTTYLDLTIHILDTLQAHYKFNYLEALQNPTQITENRFNMVDESKLQEAEQIIDETGLKEIFHNKLREITINANPTTDVISNDESNLSDTVAEQATIDTTFINNEVSAVLSTKAISSTKQVAKILRAPPNDAEKNITQKVSVAQPIKKAKEKLQAKSKIKKQADDSFLNSLSTQTFKPKEILFCKKRPEGITKTSDASKLESQF